jgi:hypothetical protein
MVELKAVLLVLLMVLQMAVSRELLMAAKMADL